MNAWGWLLSFGLLASNTRVITFDTYPVGKTPPGWVLASPNRGAQPHWEIRRDPSAPTQPYVLAQVSTAGGGHSPIALLDNFQMRDGELSVRLKPVAGHGEPAAGIVWRYRDENNYYMARADALAKNVTVFKVENGRHTPLITGVKHELSPDGWYILKAWARGNRFQVYLDHRRIVEGRDDAFTGPGKVGLWCSADSVTYFDDFRVSAR
jgi:hypothetical protein